MLRLYSGMIAMNKFILIPLVTAIGGCTSIKEKVLRDMTVAAVVGYAIGQTQQKEKDANSIMYAGVLATATAVAGLHFYDPDKQIETLKSDVTSLRKKLDQEFEPELENQMPGTLAGKIPKNYRALIQPGAWKVYAINQWIEDGDNRIIHQDKIMELIPPSLRAGQAKINNEKLKRSEK